MAVHSHTVDHPTAQRTTVSSVRIAGIAGLASVAAMVASFAVLPADQGGTDAAAIAARYADGSTGYLAAALFETLSTALLCLLVAGLGTALWARRPGSMLPVAATIGGTVLATCQLLGYALIASLAHGTAAAGDLPVVMGLYDLSSSFFVVANAGLAVLAGASGAALLTGTPRSRTLGVSSLVLAAAGVASASANAPEGFASLHGDLGFIVLLLQLVWTAAVSVWLLRSSAADA